MKNIFNKDFNLLSFLKFLIVRIISVSSGSLFVL